MKRAGWSLTGRLSRRVLAAVAVTWLLALGIGLYVLWNEMDELLDETLEAEAHMLLNMLTHATGQDDPLAGLPAPSSRQAVRVTGMTGAPRNAPWPPLPLDGAGRLDRAGQVIQLRTCVGDSLVADCEKEPVLGIVGRRIDECPHY